MPTVTLKQIIDECFSRPDFFEQIIEDMDAALLKRDWQVDSDAKEYLQKHVKSLSKDAITSLSFMFRYTDLNSTGSRLSVVIDPQPPWGGPEPKIPIPGE